ncbi:STAS domain-containing protein [Streptomyces sp. NPDC051452]|uniref:STAS domain-containing protein n=1 Tax=Streptomyces sp. NPDC051452 TaxID=3365654 RepID=UPI003797B360
MAEAERTGTEHAEQPAGRLSVVATTTDGIRVLTLAGEIDHHTGDALRRALDVADIPQPRVVLDLRQLTFMDSSGINIFLAAHRALSETGGWLRLAGPAGPVMRTMRIVGIDAVIDCHETLDQALSD